MVEGDGANYSVRAVHRVCDILDLLQEKTERVSLADIAKIIGLPKSSALRYLSTLESRRYVQRDADSGEYSVGLAFVPFHPQRFEVLRRRFRPLLEQLRDRFDETVNLGVLDGTRVYYLDGVETQRAVRMTVPAGQRDPIHSTALGKAIAVHLPADRVHAILTEEGMPARTERTIVTAKDFLAELERVRRRGYALDNCENEPDGRCVAVGLAGSRLPVAVSLSAPSARLPLERVGQVAAALQATAQQLGELLQGRS
jgi:IclR family acetate operon transcriptional repressor